MPAKTQPAVAYSYVRFSHPDQAKGDSVRRHTEAAAEWCLRNGLRLDESTTLRDLGKSAFSGEHRKNPDRHALAAFLKLVEAGKVPRGSYLIIENLDRLTREDERSAPRLWMDILDQGVNIVQLHPETVFRHEKSDMVDIMRAIIELSRGHSESARKSERNGAAWTKRRKQAREAGEILTRRLPAWVELRNGKLKLIPARAAAVKRVYQLAASGYGTAGIVKRLTEEKVPAFGTSGHWARTYVILILRDRRALGELQPRRSNGKPEGPPIPKYFPAVVTDEEWLAARAATSGRRYYPGRVGHHVNLFANLLRNARDGDTYYCATRRSTTYGTSWRVLLNTAASDGRMQAHSFPYATFERAVLTMLREIDAEEILGHSDKPDEAMVLAGRLAVIEGKIAELESELLKGDVAALAKVLRQLEAEKRELAGKLAEARQREAHPLSAAWGNAQSIAAALDNAPDPKDARLRLRSALRRIVKEIWILPVARGRDRICAAQVYFAEGDSRRDYLIFNKPPRSDGRGKSKGGAWWVRSLATTTKPGDLDLRKRDHAARLEKALVAADLTPAVGDD
jgi:DNA invertase Pin-like site-specific DNA recombinase